MSDTGARMYSKKESLNRIFQVLKGTPLTDDNPETIPGLVYSEDEALSYIAELMADSLPGSSFHLPSAIAMDYGQIYAWTGTATMTGLGTTAVKLTGTFQNTSFVDEIVGQPSQDRLLLSKTGYYSVAWNLSFFGSPDVEYMVEPYHAALGVPQAAARVKPSASGSSINIGGYGIFQATGTSELVDLRVIASAAGSWMIPWTAQITVQRIGEY